MDVLKFDMRCATFSVKGRNIRDWTDGADALQVNYTDPAIEVVQGVNMAAFIATNKGGCEVTLNLLQGGDDSKFLDGLAKESKNLKSFTPFEARYKDTISGEESTFSMGIILQRPNMTRGNAHNNTTVTIRFLEAN